MIKRQNTGKTLYEVWHQDLPGSFDKSGAIELICNHWKLTSPSVYQRIRNGRLLDVVNDIRFLYVNLSIGFDPMNGFFFDSEKYSTEQQNEELALAKQFGLLQ